MGRDLGEEDCGRKVGMGREFGELFCLLARDGGVGSGLYLPEKPALGRQREEHSEGFSRQSPHL